MSAIKGSYQQGTVVLDAPATWPDGYRVIVAPADEPFGMTDDEQSDDPEAIACWIAEFNAIPPLQMTPAEEAEWQAARKAQKELDLAKFEERAQRLKRLFE